MTLMTPVPAWTVRLTLALGLSFTALSPAMADKLRFAVGPLQLTAEDTRKAFEPFFANLAHELNADYQLVVTTD